MGLAARKIQPAGFGNMLKQVATAKKPAKSKSTIPVLGAPVVTLSVCKEFDRKVYDSIAASMF